jgi:hypothetical protein
MHTQNKKHFKILGTRIASMNVNVGTMRLLLNNEMHKLTKTIDGCNKIHKLTIVGFNDETFKAGT